MSFRFAQTKERVGILCGVLAAIVAGLCMPAMIILFGRVTNSMVYNEAGIKSSIQVINETCFNGTLLESNESSDPMALCNQMNIFKDCLKDEPNTLEFITDVCEMDFEEEMEIFGIGTAAIGAVQLLMGYIFVSSLNYAAENQVYRIRSLFLKGILRQDIGWYDTRQTGDFASRVTEDLNKLQEGIGEKIGMFLFFFTVFLASLINALYHGWKLTLVILSAMPVLMVAFGVMAKLEEEEAKSLCENQCRALKESLLSQQEIFSNLLEVVRPWRSLVFAETRSAASEEEEADLERLRSWGATPTNSLSQRERDQASSLELASHAVLVPSHPASSIVVERGVGTSPPPEAYHTCPICEDTFSQEISHEEFESHVVQHFEVDEDSFLAQFTSSDIKYKTTSQPNKAKKNVSKIPRDK
ncbi:unnamed protein product [Darwinula stevensoni]|uniref:ABC transmembrane type-1 domain-containing protein n=1 Tax=Darwinula stevensoni TaxID=69355 RepID=A0A7R8X0L4_9CRUS|nr:unnamed protein product [Darwinula stevensoni]CAG0881352.1 unnamed protein product [Darwinula stevensoni]